MTLALSPSTDDVLTQFRTFLRTCITLDENNVFQGLGNRTAMPTGPFIAFTLIGHLRYSTNTEVWADPVIFRKIAQRFDIQVDLYGPQSEEWARILTVMLRSPEGAAVGVQYTDEARRMPITNEEQQYEDRWSLTAYLQVNSTVTVPAEFMDEINVTVQPPANYA